MGGKGGGQQQPQAAVNIPARESYYDNILQYSKAYPEIFKLMQEYGPKEAELGLDLLQEFGPQYDQYAVQQQKELTPYTYGLQEQLAKLAFDNSGANPDSMGYGMVPSALKSAYLDQFRSEVGPNAGSGIGADYVSNNLARVSEDYKGHYQNLGLSLLGRIPNQAPSTPSFSNPASGLGNALNYNASTYGNYVQGLTNVPYYYPKKGGMFNSGGMMSGAGAGALAGLALAAPTGGLSIPMGMALGSGAGGFMGGFGG